MGEGNTTADRYRQLLVDHEPEAGRWGAACRGPHEVEVSWPCREIRRLNQPDTYPTNVQVAAR